jgi:hypothetical protein
MGLAEFESTGMRGKWFKVNNLNHSATETARQQTPQDTWIEMVYY